MLELALLSIYEYKRIVAAARKQLDLGNVNCGLLNTPEYDRSVSVEDRDSHHRIHSPVDDNFQGSPIACGIPSCCLVVRDTALFPGNVMIMSAVVGVRWSWR